MFGRLRLTRQLAVLGSLLLSVSSGLAEGEGVFKNVFFQPNELQQGSVMFFTVELEKPARKVSGTLLGKELSFFAGRSRRSGMRSAGWIWRSLRGVTTWR